MPPQYKVIPLSELPLHSDFMFGQVMRAERFQMSLDQVTDILSH